jgi:hypothetical protein
MLFFLFGRRYPLLRLAVGVAALVLGLVVHSYILIAAGAVLTVVGAGMAAASLRRRGLTGGKAGGRSLR